MRSGKCSPEPLHLGCKHAAAPRAPQKLPADTGQGEMERCGKLSTLLVQFKPEDSIVIKVPVSIISPVLSDASSASVPIMHSPHTPHQLIGNWGRDGAHLPILASDWSSDGHVTSIVTSDWFRFVIMDCLLSFKTYINGFKMFTRIKARHKRGHGCWLY